jgi:hypothetical protein
MAFAITFDRGSHEAANSSSRKRWDFSDMVRRNRVSFEVAQGFRFLRCRTANMMRTTAANVNQVNA